MAEGGGEKIPKKIEKEEEKEKEEDNILLDFYKH